MIEYTECPTCNSRVDVKITYWRIFTSCGCSSSESLRWDMSIEDKFLPLHEIIKKYTKYHFKTFDENYFYKPVNHNCLFKYVLVKNEENENYKKAILVGKIRNTYHVAEITPAKFYTEGDFGFESGKIYSNCVREFAGIYGDEDDRI